MADTNTLLNDARCIDCNITGGMRLSVLISLFAKIAGVSADPNSLIAGAVCIDCAIPDGMKESVLISLAEQIVVNGGTGGGGGMQCGNYGGAQPNFTPATACGSAVDTSTGQIWLYYNGQWQ